jgi:surfeit locus 1 family protein
VPPVSHGGRGFRPSLPFTVLLLTLSALFVRLGVWQWHRGVLGEAEWASFAHGTDQLQDLGARAVSAVPLFQRVSVTGRLDGAHQFLVDNRSYRGRAGYEVLTPLTRAAADTLLVDRGWVPFTGRRAQLPDLTLGRQSTVTLTGRLAELPKPGLTSGRAAPDERAPWPKVTSSPDMQQLAGAYGAALAPRLLLLDREAPFGYARDWTPPGMPPLRHFSYAIQWWSFALLAIAVWVLMSIRRASLPEP